MKKFKKHYSKILMVALIACRCFMALIGTGEGRGSGLMLIIAGLLMVVDALVLGSRKSIREVEVANCEYELKNA